MVLCDGFSHNGPAFTALLLQTHFEDLYMNAAATVARRAITLAAGFARVLAAEVAAAAAVLQFVVLQTTAEVPAWALAPVIAAVHCAAAVVDGDVVVEFQQPLVKIVVPLMKLGQIPEFTLAELHVIWIP